MSEKFTVFPDSPESDPKLLSQNLTRKGVFFEIVAKSSKGVLTLNLLDEAAHARREFIQTVRESAYDF